MPGVKGKILDRGGSFSSPSLFEPRNDFSGNKPPVTSRVQAWKKLLLAFFKTMVPGPHPRMLTLCLLKLLYPLVPVHTRKALCALGLTRHQRPGASQFKLFK